MEASSFFSAGVSFFGGDDLGFVPLKESPEALREVSSIVGSSTGRLFFGEGFFQSTFLYPSFAELFQFYGCPAAFPKLESLSPIA